MNARVCVAVAVLLVASVGGAESPPLQPGVKEYKAGVGIVNYSAATVIYQDQEQCRIGAGEIPATGRKIAYTGSDNLTDGIMIAVADSVFGRKLVAAFALDVPEKKQGYAIRVDGTRAAIVGHDAIGALYGAETFRQMMANGGKVKSAIVRDWPDIFFRGGVSIGRGLWKWVRGDGGTECLEHLKRGIDELVRHKINGIEEVLLWHKGQTVEAYREVLAYARARGVRTFFNCHASLWSDCNCPPGMAPQKWPCVTGVRKWSDRYYCWADDAEIEASANRCIDYLLQFGLEDPIVQIHPVDACYVDDPEFWSRRCAKCRARWRDDERWMASANLLNIWRRAFDRRLPKAMFVSPVVPYWISKLEVPQEKQSRLWRQNVVDYWMKLDAALTDRNLAFESWIAARSTFDKYRRLVPHRPVFYTDNYPDNPGLFLTCRRKIGTMCESDGRTGYRMTGTDSYGCWESCLLAAEYAWDAHAPGWEPYDGVTYWHPVLDTTGPEIVMTNVLPRICRTFWGDALAPHMCKVMSSGVLPKYLDNPASAMSMWNKMLRNALFDPGQTGIRPQSGNAARLLEDSRDFRIRQLAAAETCARAFDDARPLAGSLVHFKRSYFDALADAAPRWRDLARWLVARQEVDDAFEGDDIARARTAVRTAVKDVKTQEVRSRLERISALLDARSDDSAVPPGKGRAGKSPPGRRRGRAAEVWHGERIIDGPFIVNRRNVRIMPGAKIMFRGEGCLRVEHGSFHADGATFVGSGVLTNAWRIYISGETIELANCRFDGLSAHNPGGKRWFRGGVRLSSPSVRVTGCRFDSMQSLTLVNCRKAVVEDNVFSCTDSGVYLLDAPESHIARNVFAAHSGGKSGVELSKSPRSEVVHNRFAGLDAGVCAHTGSSHVMVAGNVFEKCGRPVLVRGSKGVVVIDAAGTPADD